MFNWHNNIFVNDVFGFLCIWSHLWEDEWSNFCIIYSYFYGFCMFYTAYILRSSIVLFYFQAQSKDFICKWCFPATSRPPKRFIIVSPSLVYTFTHQYNFVVNYKVGRRFDFYSCGYGLSQWIGLVITYYIKYCLSLFTLLSFFFHFNFIKALKTLSGPFFFYMGLWFCVSSSFFSQTDICFVSFFFFTCPAESEFSFHPAAARWILKGKRLLKFSVGE